MIINAGFISLLALAAIHLFANQAKVMGWIWHDRFLSFAAGSSFAYVFVGLLPALEKGEPVLQKTFGEIVPFLDRHSYIIALAGVLFYYGLNTQSKGNSKRNWWLSMSGYLLFNFFVGASLTDSNNPEIQPLLLFTIALGMHYFVHDHNATVENPLLFRNEARWLLVGALVGGYIVGSLLTISNTIEVIVVSFLAGGVILNALRYELPKREKVGYFFFLLGAVLYTAILLKVGQV